MTIDLAAAADFMTTHARLLDRHRLRIVLGDGDPAATLAALEAYRNPDGGYGWGLEPDLRSASSQPGAALHAFEALADLAPAVSPHAGPLCDWLGAASLDDGGLPFALPLDDPSGSAPFWAQADHRTSSLQITAAVTAMAHRVARHDPVVAAHPWLGRATAYCVDAIRTVDAAPHAYVLMFALQFLDAAHEAHPDARELITRLGAHLPPDGVLPVEGGSPDEVLRPLDVATRPGTPVRALYADDIIAADLDRLAGRQQADGGWIVDFASYSPAAAMEWRGYATVAALAVLRDNGLVPVDVVTAAATAR